MKTIPLQRAKCENCNLVFEFDPPLQLVIGPWEEEIVDKVPCITVKFRKLWLEDKPDIKMYQEQDDDLFTFGAALCCSIMIDKTIKAQTVYYEASYPIIKTEGNKVYMVV